MKRKENEKKDAELQLCKNVGTFKKLYYKDIFKSGDWQAEKIYDRSAL